MNINHLYNIPVSLAPKHRFLAYPLATHFRFGLFSRKTQPTQKEKSWLGRLFGRREQRLPLSTRVKNRLTPAFLRREIVMPDGSIVIRPSLRRRLQDAAKSPKVYLQGRLDSYLQKPLKRRMSRILMWLGLAVFIYAVGSQIPRELRLYLQTRTERKGEGR